MKKQLLPLEELFRARASKRPTELPQMNADYFSQYKQLLNVFRTTYYPKVDAGLAANSGAPGLYTAHDSEHFDEVVHHAGELINAESSLKGEMTSAASELNAYELYILLVAIRVHDVGNLYGREDHEKRCFQILREIGGAAGLDDREKKAIANIAQAHGGRTSAQSKDTIGQLEVRLLANSVSYRPRLLAGIVRIADEICENKRRAATVLMQSGKLPKHNEIYHQYAGSLTGNRWIVNDRALHLTFEPRLSEVEKPWGCEERTDANKTLVSEAYLLDEIFARLEKMDLERRYCNMFTREIFTIDAIKVTITVVTDDHHDPIQIITVPELSDRGYPEKLGQGLRSDMKEFCGPNFGASLRLKQKGA
jgi:hypothetical protein